MYKCDYMIRLAEICDKETIKNIYKNAESFIFNRAMNESLIAKQNIKNVIN